MNEWKSYDHSLYIIPQFLLLNINVAASITKENQSERLIEPQPGSPSLWAQSLASVWRRTLVPVELGGPGEAFPRTQMASKYPPKEMSVNGELSLGPTWEETHE